MPASRPTSRARAGIARATVAASACVAALLALTSCATVINETTDRETVESTLPTDTTTTIPRGDIVSLLEQLVTSADGLGEDIANRQNSRAQQRAADASAIWIALEPQIRVAGIDVVEDLNRMVQLLNTAVDRRRPADADKAFRFISIIAEEIPALL